MVVPAIQVSGKLRRARDNPGHDGGGRRSARRTRALVATEAICYMLRRRSTPGRAGLDVNLPIGELSDAVLRTAMRSWRNW